MIRHTFENYTNESGHKLIRCKKCYTSAFKNLASFRRYLDPKPKKAKEAARSTTLFRCGNKNGEIYCYTVDVVKSKRVKCELTDEDFIVKSIIE